MLHASSDFPMNRDKDFTYMEIQIIRTKLAIKKGRADS